MIIKNSVDKNSRYYKINMIRYKENVLKYFKKINKEKEFLNIITIIEDDVIKLAQDFKYDIDIEKLINENSTYKGFYKINFEFICDFTKLDLKSFYLKNIIEFKKLTRRVFTITKYKEIFKFWKQNWIKNLNL